MERNATGNSVPINFHSRRGKNYLKAKKCSNIKDEVIVIGAALPGYHVQFLSKTVSNDIV